MALGVSFPVSKNNISNEYSPSIHIQVLEDVTINVDAIHKKI